MLIPNPRLVLGKDEVEAPMTSVLNGPVTANGTSELLHAYRQTADVIAFLHRLFAVAPTHRHHQANRFQTLPQFEVRQSVRHRHLDVDAPLLAAVAGFLGRIPTSLGADELVLALLVDLVDDPFV